jgi:repressor of nif and glnA expression
MRGRSTDYCFIDPMILDVLEKSDVPVQALGVSFKVNEMSGKIINLNVVKSHLEDLVERKKVVKNVDKDESIFYTLRK